MKYILQVQSWAFKAPHHIQVPPERSGVTGSCRCTLRTRPLTHGCPYTDLKAELGELCPLNYLQTPHITAQWSYSLRTRVACGVANVRFGRVWWGTRTAERCSEGKAGKKTPSFTRTPSALGLVQPQVSGTSLQIHAVTLSRYSLHGMRCFRARFRRSTERSRCRSSGEGAAQQPGTTPGRPPDQAPSPPLPHHTGKEPEPGWSPEPPALPPRRPALPLHRTSPRLAGKERAAVPRRALTYTDGVGEPCQSLPQQPRQQQQEGPGCALPHFLQSLRFSPYNETGGTGMGATGDSDAGGGSGEDGPPPFFPASSSFFFFFLRQILLLLSSPQPGRAHWLGGCLSPPVSSSPPQRRDFPQRWWVAEPTRLLRPGRERVIDQTWREAGWQPLGSARPARPAPALGVSRPRRQRSGLRSEGAHRPPVGRSPGCSWPL